MSVNSRYLYGPGPGVFYVDVRVPDSTAPGAMHPHTIDVFLPPLQVIRYWLVLLHGGGGSKWFFERATAIVKGQTVNRKTVNWPFLFDNEVGVAVVNGERCTGVQGPFNPHGVNTVSPKYPDGIRTWSNRVFWSQANDAQMLKDLAVHLKALVMPTAGMVLIGHSSGGIMCQHMWFEHWGHYDRYYAVAGPAAPDYDPVFGTIGLPPAGQRKPFYEIIGAQDYNVGVTRAELGVFAPVWYAPPENFTRSLVVYDPTKPLNQQTPSRYSGSWGQFKRRVQAERPAAELVAGAPAAVLAAKIGSRALYRDMAPGLSLSFQYNYEVFSAAGHAWLSNRRKPENAPGISQCRGANVLRYITQQLLP